MYNRQNMDSEKECYLVEYIIDQTFIDPEDCIEMEHTLELLELLKHFEVKVDIWSFLIDEKMKPLIKLKDLMIN